MNRFAYSLCVRFAFIPPLTSPPNLWGLALALNPPSCKLNRILIFPSSSLNPRQRQSGAGFGRRSA